MTLEYGVKVYSHTDEMRFRAELSFGSRQVELTLGFNAPPRELCEQGTFPQEVHRARFEVIRGLEDMVGDAKMILYLRTLAGAAISGYYQRENDWDRRVRSARLSPDAETLEMIRELLATVAATQKEHQIVDEKVNLPEDHPLAQKLKVLFHNNSVYL